MSYRKVYKDWRGYKLLVFLARRQPVTWMEVLVGLLPLVRKTEITAAISMVRGIKLWNNLYAHIERSLNL